MISSLVFIRLSNWHRWMCRRERERESKTNAQQWWWGWFHSDQSSFWYIVRYIHWALTTISLFLSLHLTACVAYDEKWKLTSLPCIKINPSFPIPLFQSIGNRSQSLGLREMRSNNQTSWVCNCVQSKAKIIIDYTISCSVCIREHWLLAL